MSYREVARERTQFLMTHLQISAIDAIFVFDEIMIPKGPSINFNVHHNPNNVRIDSDPLPPPPNPNSQNTEIKMALDNPWPCSPGGAVAEWVRPLDWRLGGTSFESCCGNVASANPFTPLCQCISEETLTAVGPFYVVSMPEEVKYPTSLHWKCVTCCGLHTILA